MDLYFDCLGCQFVDVDCSEEPCKSCEKSKKGGTNHKTAGNELPDCYNCIHNTVCGLRKSIYNSELPEQLTVIIKCDAFYKRN